MTLSLSDVTLQIFPCHLNFNHPTIGPTVNVQVFKATFLPLLSSQLVKAIITNSNNSQIKKKTLKCLKSLYRSQISRNLII